MCVSLLICGLPPILDYYHWVRLLTVVPCNLLPSHTLQLQGGASMVPTAWSIGQAPRIEVCRPFWKRTRDEPFQFPFGFLDVSKNQKAGSLWTLASHKPVIPTVAFLTPHSLRLLRFGFSRNHTKGSLGRGFPPDIFTEDVCQAIYWPYSLQKVSVLFVMTFVQLRYLWTVVPPQTSSPHDAVR